jgi:sugar O-acyltransferase (sialic acid O-acetyltransferase NeuD family)
MAETLTPAARPVVVYGNGAMARVLHAFAAQAFPIAGFTVDAACIPRGESTFQGLPLVPFEAVASRFPPDRFDALVAVGFAGMNDLRRARHEALAAMGYGFASYVHPSVVRHPGVVIEDGCIVYDHVALHPGTRVARGSFIASNASLGHDCVVGPFGWINSGVALAGGVEVGEQSFFGVNASVADGVRLGVRSYVGAGTLVARDTEADSVTIAPAGERFPVASRSFLKFIARRVGPKATP